MIRKHQRFSTVTARIERRMGPPPSFGDRGVDVYLSV